MKMKSVTLLILAAVLISLLYEAESKPVDDPDSIQGPMCDCPYSIMPVCASNNKTYANDCEMRCASQDLTMEHEGICQPDNGKDESGSMSKDDLFQPIEAENSEDKDDLFQSIETENTENE
ncbi:hypothetical protein LSTR_LSTR001136 [Laodelphax striatellus]|uniref:Kazal-like domain-containing protein n=1 Tax=Laodelphax striatellus TaxID=195883 RepID=A0A482X187_LAOST|nr:hypothetical protein LSTR_LSTR001136 [Laodelphax striatellus]